MSRFELTDGRVLFDQHKTRKRKEPSRETKNRTPGGLLPIVDGLPPQPPSKRRKSSRADKSRDLFVPWEPVTIQNVQESYREAMNAGWLHSSSVPRLKPAVHKTWDPYVLTKNFNSALLEKNALCKLHKQLDKTLKTVPEVTRWATQIEECGLIPTNLSDILRTAFGFEVHQIRQPIADGEMPWMLRMASFLLDRANTLEAEQTISRQAMAVARIVGYALMRVCEVADGLTTSQVSMMHIFNVPMLM